MKKKHLFALCVLLFVVNMIFIFQFLGIQDELKSSQLLTHRWKTEHQEIGTNFDELKEAFSTLLSFEQSEVYEEAKVSIVSGKEITLTEIVQPNNKTLVLRLNQGNCVLCLNKAMSMLSNEMDDKLKSFQIIVLSDIILKDILLREYNVKVPLYFYDDTLSEPLFKIKNNAFPIFFELYENSWDIKSAFVFPVGQPDLLSDYFNVISK